MAVVMQHPAYRVCAASDKGVDVMCYNAVHPMHVPHWVVRLNSTYSQHMLHVLGVVGKIAEVSSLSLQRMCDANANKPD